MRALVEAFSRIAEIERRQAGMIRHGTVAEVDPAAGTVRIKLGTATGGGDLLSPPVPYSQMAGGLKAHIPPTVGQQFTMFSPSGDYRQAVALPLTWSDENESPGTEGDQNVVTFGDVKVEMGAGELRVSVGASSITLTAGGIVLQAPRIDIN
jgi:phage baseplate assembly protein V